MPEQAGDDTLRTPELGPLEDVYRVLLDNLVVGLALVVEGQILYANPTLQELTGRSLDGLVGKSPAVALTRNGEGAVKERTEQLLSGLTVGPAEYTIVRPDGSTLPVESISRPVEYKGRPAFLSVIVDISARKAAQRRLEAHIAHLEAIARLSEAMQRTLDADRLLQDFVDIVYEVFACDRAWLMTPLDADTETYAVPYIRTRPGCERPGGPGVGQMPVGDLERYVLRRMATADGPVSVDFTPPPAGLEESAKRLNLGSVLAVPVRPRRGPAWLLGLTQCGSARGWTEEHTTLLRDMSHRAADALSNVLLYRELEQSRRQLHRTVAELERSNAELERFAAFASHDMKEPLRTITNTLHLLERKCRERLEPEAHWLLDAALKGAFRMGTVIDDLLAYARAGTATPVCEAVPAGEALCRALENLEAAITESRAQVHYGELPTVMADRSQLALLFQNLVGNAIEHSGVEALRVDVYASRAGSYWTFSVADNGIGVSPEHAVTLFEAFHRPAASGCGRGSGLGLAICRRIVEGHGGRIWVEARPEGGTVFRFTLRCAEAP